MPFESKFPVVGVAASTGGLAAFTQLRSHLAVNTGMAFVLIQHLAPAADFADLPRLSQLDWRSIARHVGNYGEIFRFI